MSKYDKYWIGIVIGLILPALFGWAYLETFDLWNALRAFNFAAGTMLWKLMLVITFPDMALLYLFYSLDTWRLSKGVLIGAFPYILAAVFFSCF